MSGILEKSFSSLLNSVFGIGNLSGSESSVSAASGLKNVSFGLISFVERLEAARKISKQEEEEVFGRECQDWLKQLSRHNSNSGLITDLLCRAIIAVSRGHNSPDLQIHAIKLTQSNNILHKKIGYLFLSTAMSPDSDLTLLMVNTIQKDLSSTNIIEICTALNLVPTITAPDIMPVIANSLVHCLDHQQSYIRRRAAIMTTSLTINSSEDFDYHSFLIPKLLNLLSDVDPGVAIAATVALSKIYKKVPEVPEKKILRDQISKSCAHLLLEATGGSLPSHYNIGHIRAPFVQIQILKALQLIGSRDWDVPEIVPAGIEAVFTRQRGKELCLYMVLFEAVQTIPFLPKTDHLLVSTITVIMGFIQSSSIDFKYLGVKLLSTHYESLKENLTDDHVQAVMQCLDLSHRLLQDRTFELLCNLTGDRDYKKICTTFYNLSKGIIFPKLRRDVFVHISDLLKRLCCDTGWCFDFLSPIIKSPDCRFEILDAMGFVARKELKNPDKKLDLVLKDCENICEVILKMETPSTNHMSLVFTILEIVYSQRLTTNDGIVKALISAVETMELNTLKDESFHNCILALGLNYPKYSEKASILLQKSATIHDNLSLRIKAKRCWSLLKHSDITHRAMKQQSCIESGSYKPDLTFSFYDLYVIESLERGEMLINIPLTLHIKDDAESTLIHTIDKGSLSTSGSLGRNSSYGGSNASASVMNADLNSYSYRASTPLKWTSKGRLDPKTDTESFEGEILSSLNMEDIEVAAEADEDSLEQSPVSLSASILDSNKAEFAQMILKSFRVSKDS